MTGFVGSDWLPDSELAEMFHWPTPDAPRFAVEDECVHGRLPGDRSAPCGCWPWVEGQAA